MDYGLSCREVKETSADDFGRLETKKVRAGLGVCYQRKTKSG